MAAKPSQVLLRQHAAGVNLQHLRFIVAAADSGSFRQAADCLSIRQSTLSRRIRQFESSIGFAIFERSTSGVEPTTAGHGILRVSRTILEDFDALISGTFSKSHGQVGRLVLGFCSSLTSSNLRAMLLELSQRFAEVELAAVEKPHASLSRMLRNGTVDILVIPQDGPLAEFRSMRLWTERIFISLHKDHRLCERELLYSTDVRDETILLSRDDVGSEFENLVRSKLLPSLDRPAFQIRDVTREAIRAFVSMGLGISVLLESDAAASLPSAVYRELHDGTGPIRLGFSAFWRTENENPALTAFVKLLRERYPSPTAGT